ncbi:MAG: hypothetical protein GOV02_00595 [Candidatus Aenigmarchaeota archaeon]|nr:hypothetical protein [Candidatus Aenigmarchaeota archaeon]
MKKREPVVAGDYIAPLITGGTTVASLYLTYRSAKEGNVAGVVVGVAGTVISGGATVLGGYHLFKKTIGNGELLWD